MKFERVSLEKYGAIAARDIDLTSTPGLVIIHGPNEAGKSTLLSAISDLLYGVPHTSPHGAIFGNNAIQIGATLRLAGGEVLTLRRKKGRGQGTLVDAGGVPMSAKIETVLSGTDRDRFTGLFGLDHNSLREGGQKLLAADGEIGRLIVEAGGGLRALVAALSELESEADTLFSSTRSGKRRFYPALDIFLAADKEAKQATTTREAFLKSKKAEAAASDTLLELRQQQIAARETMNRLARLIRVAPQFRQLVDIEQALGAFADIEELSDALATEIPKSSSAYKADIMSHEEAQLSCDVLQKQLDALVIAGDLVEAAEAIEAAETLALHVEKARLDLPNRHAELADGTARLDRLRAFLGVEPDTSLEERAPSRDAIDAIQALATEGVSVRTELNSATERLSECQSLMADAQLRQSNRKEQGYDKPAPFSAVELNRLPSLSREIETDKVAADVAKLDLESRAKALNLGPVLELARQLWPTLDDVKDEVKRAASIEAEIRQAQNEHTAAAARATRAEKRTGKLATGVEPPTPEAVSDARSERDQLWGDIRGRYLDAAEEDWARPPAAERQLHAAQFEQSRDAADQLVDRRGLEAQRLADIASAEGERAEAEGDAARLAQVIKDLQQQLATDRQIWAQTWPTPATVECDLRRLAALTEKRDRIIAEQASLKALEATLTERTGEVTLQHDLLVQVELLSPSKDELSLLARVQRATAILKAHDDQYGDFRRDAEVIADLAIQERKWTQTLAELGGRQKAWSASWSAAIAMLGLNGEVSTQRATEVATEWASAVGVFNELRLTNKRIQRIHEDEQKLQLAISALRMKLAIELPDDVVAAARHLKRKLAESTGRALQRETLTPQVEKARLILQTTAERLKASTLKLTKLAADCHCEAAELEPFATRIAERAKLKLKRETLIHAILAAGDGHTLESLRDQWQREDPDSLAGQLATLNIDVARRDNDIVAAIAAQQSAEADVKAFLSDDRLNGLIAEREAASTDMHRIIERYVEITLAQTLLKAAIEKVRHEQQDPLLARASQLFSASTRGQFAAIETDVNDDGHPIVVGRRLNGDLVGLSEMSDGTRDQLFLAFRLASIEHYGRNAEPLPFIADDVLVHFDDDRGFATLELLAEVGVRNQILLFTHHEAVVTAAAPLVAAGTAAVINLAG